MIARFFRALWTFLKTPWVVALAVTLLCILLVWLLGPLVAIAGHVILEGVVARLVATALLLFCWGLFTALYYSRRRKLELANPDKAAEYEEKRLSRSRFREEVDVIKDRLKQAVRIVTTSDFYGPKGRSRYVLPWYLVIGSQNCGKSAMLLGSGLQFPLNEQADRHLYSLKATEHIELLYSNEAVFVDTPGAYALSAPDTPTHRIWKALLRRLFAVRPARPLNGIIVCVSMRDIIDADQARREHLARTLRARLSECLQALRNYAPVYLVFTKCDAVPGFASFFAHLSRREREQIFGCPAKEDGMQPGEVRKELKDLLQTLNAQIIPKIHQERDPEARGDIFRFPQEMALLAPRIEDCLSETFGPSRYHKPVMFRGFFFTSALSTHDLLAAAAREGEWSFQKGFAPAGGDYAKGFFLLRLLEKCIIPEARLAAVDKDHVWSQRFRRFGPQIAAATLFLFAGVFLGLSFVNNYQRLDTLSTVYAAFASEQEKRPTIVDPGAALPELSHLARSIDVYQPGADSEITLGLGLYQGRTFEPAVDAAYLGALNSRLMPAVRDVAARKVEAALDGNMGDLKNALRAYLMLCRPEFLNRNFIDRWLGRRWAERYAGQTAVQNNLRDSMDYLIAHGIVPVAPDAALLDRARRALLKTPPAELVYQRLQEEAKESGKPPFTFRAAIGESPFDGDTFPIPALYTRAGYDEYLIERCPDIIRELTDESWIFDKNPLALRMLDVTKVHREVMVMYFRDYTQHWNQALQRLAVRMPQTIADARNLAGQLTAGAPPAVLALREIRANTSFSPDSAAPGAVESAAQQELARKAKQRLARATGARLAGALVGQAQKDAESLRNESALAAEREAASVRQFFAPLTALLDDTGNAGTVLKATNDSMAAAAEYFARIVSSDDREQRVLTALLEIADEKDETLRRVEIAAEPLPSPLREWYSTVVSGGLRDMLAIGASAINRAYRVKVLAGYNSKLRHCYPFNMHTDVDANLEDFADFFRSGGLLDSFYDANLLPFVGKNGLRSIMGRTLPISALALGQLQRANRVQQAFFLSGRELGISFLMEPHAMDAQLKEITLRNADKTLSYWHGPVEGARLAWPNGDKASLNFIDLNNIDLKTEARGDWALFRILRSGSIKRQEGNTCLIEVQKNGKWGQFLIQFRNRVNPFDPSVCSFRLPDSLL